MEVLLDEIAVRVPCLFLEAPELIRKVPLPLDELKPVFLDVVLAQLFLGGHVMGWLMRNRGIGVRVGLESEAELAHIKVPVEDVDLADALLGHEQLHARVEWLRLKLVLRGDLRDDPLGSEPIVKSAREVRRAIAFL